MRLRHLYVAFIFLLNWKLDDKRLCVYVWGWGVMMGLNCALPSLFPHAVARLKSAPIIKGWSFLLSGAVAFSPF